ncbi:MAG TPA: hypothetical protein VFP47_02400, partial [Pyrinomonadaceae bacterium]|nr:hypothetical protein [Pyrinomonadaceae bacterium]
MTRVNQIAFRLILTSLLLILCFAATALAQTPSPSPSPSPSPPPFALEPPPTLPAGMTGSDTSDPRTRLTPGIYDAGEAAMGLKHIFLLKKPDVFQLGSNDPNDPKVSKFLGQMGANATELAKIPKPLQLVAAQLGF